MSCACPQAWAYARGRTVARAMVGLVEAAGAGAVDAEQARLPVGFIESVEVDEETHDAISEAMAEWLQPRVHDLADIERPPRRARCGSNR